MKKLFKVIYYIFLGAIALIAILLLVSAFPIPRLFGGQAVNYKVLTVLSGSMEPAIHTGSVVVIKPHSTSSGQVDYKVGDIITFGATSKTQVTTTHRIVEIKDSNGQQVYITKGDANNAPDAKEIPQNQIIGKVLVDVPYLGYAVDAAKKPLGFVFIIAVPALIIIGDEIKKIFLEVKRIKKSRAENKTENIEK